MVIFTCGICQPHKRTIWDNFFGFKPSCVYSKKKEKKKKFYHASEKKCSCVVTTILVQELPKYEIQVWDRVDPGHYLDTKLSWKILKKVYRLKRKTKINISCRRFHIVGFVSIKLRNLNCAKKGDFCDAVRFCCKVIVHTEKWHI